MCIDAFWTVRSMCIALIEQLRAEKFACVCYQFIHIIEYCNMKKYGLVQPAFNNMNEEHSLPQTSIQVKKVLCRPKRQWDLQMT